MSETDTQAAPERRPLTARQIAEACEALGPFAAWQTVDPDNMRDLLLSAARELRRLAPGEFGQQVATDSDAELERKLAAVNGFAAATSPPMRFVEEALDKVARGHHEHRDPLDAIPWAREVPGEFVDAWYYCRLGISYLLRIRDREETPVIYAQRIALEIHDLDAASRCAIIGWQMVDGDRVPRWRVRLCELLVRAAQRVLGGER